VDQSFYDFVVRDAVYVEASGIDRGGFDIVLICGRILAKDVG
jgi:hypothetical protein